MIIPTLMGLKDYINEKNNQETVHPIIIILAVLLVLYSIQAVFYGLFGAKQEYRMQG